MTSLKIRVLWPDGRKRRYLLRLAEVGPIRVIGPEHLNAPIAFTVIFEGGQGWIRPSSQQDNLFEAVDPGASGRPWREHREMPLNVGTEFYLRAGADYFGVQILEIPEIPKSVDIRQLVHPPQSRPEAQANLPVPIGPETRPESEPLPDVDPWLPQILAWASSKRRTIALGVGAVATALLAVWTIDLAPKKPDAGSTMTAAAPPPSQPVAETIAANPAPQAQVEIPTPAPIASPPPTLSLEEIFFSALDQGDQARVRDMLIAKAIDVDLAQRDGYGALHIAAARGDVGMVKVLITQGADPNMLDAQGSTALMWSVFRRHLPVVRYLAPKSNLQIMRSSGERAVDLARRLEYKELISLTDPDLAAPQVVTPPKAPREKVLPKRTSATRTGSIQKTDRERRPSSLPAKKPANR